MYGLLLCPILFISLSNCCPLTGRLRKGRKGTPIMAGDKSSIEKIIVTITKVNDSFVYFELERKSVSIAMRETLQGSQPGMKMELEYDHARRDFGPIKGARLIEE
jgi:hypothetical protein